MDDVPTLRSLRNGQVGYINHGWLRHEPESDEWYLDVTGVLCSEQPTELTIVPVLLLGRLTHYQGLNDEKKLKVEKVKGGWLCDGKFFRLENRSDEIAVSVL